MIGARDSIAALGTAWIEIGNRGSHREVDLAGALRKEAQALSPNAYVPPDRFPAFDFSGEPWEANGTLLAG